MVKKIIGYGLLVIVIFFIAILKIPSTISPSVSKEIKANSIEVQALLSDIEKFRLANALKPGTLNEDTQTQALLLATDLAAQENATDNVEDLLRFATKFCEKIHANICDSERQPLSAESIKDLKMRASRYLLNDEEPN